eukprot:767684-Hanusia_phi.AAC.9
MKADKSPTLFILLTHQRDDHSIASCPVLVSLRWFVWMLPKLAELSLLLSMTLESLSGDFAFHLAAAAGLLVASDHPAAVEAAAAVVAVADQLVAAGPLA